MSALPPISRDLERFVARQIIEFDREAWKGLTVQKRQEWIRVARRALRAERRFLLKAAPEAAAA